MTRGFRLARVLGIRTQLRKLLQDEVALLGARLASLRVEAALARRTREGARTAFEAATTEGMTGAELIRYGAYDSALAMREATLAEQVARALEAVVRGRDELLVRRREERKLERLRDRAGARAQAEEARAEALLVDEAALRRRR